MNFPLRPSPPLREASIARNHSSNLRLVSFQNDEHRAIGRSASAVHQPPFVQQPCQLPQIESRRPTKYWIHSYSSLLFHNCLFFSVIFAFFAVKSSCLLRFSASTLRPVNLFLFHCRHSTFGTLC